MRLFPRILSAKSLLYFPNSDRNGKKEASAANLTPFPKDLSCNSTIQVQKSRGGGTTCCVPGRKNSTKRNRNISFHKFPKNQKLRKEWIHWIGRQNFSPNEHHRVCSEHFPGGKKSYLNNVPTLTPKLLKPTPTKPRQTYKCRERTPFAVLTDNSNNDNNYFTENTVPKTTTNEARGGDSP